MKEKKIVSAATQKECKLEVPMKRYVAQELSIDDGRLMKSYVVILLKGRPFETERTPFSGFFRSKEIINLSIETKSKTYARAIVPFLNYVLIDSPNRVDNIGDLTLELAEEYFSAYTSGLLYKTKEPKKPGSDTFKKVGKSLTLFLKWLCCSKKHGIKMKHIKKSVFDNEKNIFAAEPHTNSSLPRLQNLTPFLVAEFIDVALEHDPMIALGITLQAFVGMRAGDICQMTGHRFVWICNSWDFIQDEDLLKEIKDYLSTGGAMNAYINLEQEYVLRSDGVRAGGIKIHRKQPIFEPFLPFIQNAYSKHLKLLDSMGINNRYNALFIDDDGRAMKTRQYSDRFKSVCGRLLERLQELEGFVPEASEALRLLDTAKLMTHSLRYFYTNQISEYVDTPHLLAYYRGDKSLVSAMNYIQSNPKTRKFIQDVQDSFGESYKRLIS